MRIYALLIMNIQY